MAAKMAAACGQFAFVDTLTSSFTTLFPPNLSPGCFQISYMVIMDYFDQKLPQVWTWVLSHNQDGGQNGLHLLICTCGNSNIFYHPISSKFHIWIIFIKLSPKIEYEFCPMNNNQHGRQNGYLLSTAGHYAGALHRNLTSSCPCYLLEWRRFIKKWRR